MKKIYINFKIPKTPKTFLKRLFSCIPIHSIYVSAVSTYYDKECNKLQCLAGKWRSFEDTLICVNTYFPNINEKSLMKLLLKLRVRNRHNQICYLKMNVCSDIKRINILFVSNLTNYNSIRYCGKYNSKYSWVELLSMININSQDDLDKYISC